MILPLKRISICDFSQKNNMSPENQWLEDVSPIEIVPFLGDIRSFSGVLLPVFFSCLWSKTTQTKHPEDCCFHKICGWSLQSIWSVELAIACEPRNLWIDIGLLSHRILWVREFCGWRVDRPSITHVISLTTYEVQQLQLVEVGGLQGKNTKERGWQIIGFLRGWWWFP